MLDPFRSITEIWKVAYHMTLPETAGINDVFHVGILKWFHGAAPSSTPTLLAMENGGCWPPPHWMSFIQVFTGESS